ncbi:D-glycero-beta-D-manno-heptose-7-phosphate kinase [Sulfurospirillum arcachonense]|uniref:D-glycero-beta-D-manno-heptose-7-phosphate kinase n=1 Tax=Sulfurospirillum arcachonense TaxID=57666 RepID=UPI000469BEF3|nr:D-glycero-beta-D-manno-heptose-7-phosphate kinase [Sulfurospirillum arcachonense]
MDRLKSYKPRILVVGDLMLDHYLWGNCERISPEAPVQVVDVKKETTVLGGAGNVINNLLAMGANVNVLSVIGEDSNGEELLEMLSDSGADASQLVKKKGRNTSKKSRVIAAHQQIIRYDSESKNDIDEKSEMELFNRFKKIITDVDALLLSDYGKGVLTESLTCKLIKCAKKHEKFILVDPKGEDYSKYKGATLITPNKKEAVLATKIDIQDEQSLYEAGELLKDSLELDYTIITLSEDGMAIFGEEVTKVPTVAREVFDVTGAGDTVLASFGYALSCGLDIKEAALFATSAAAVVVGKLGSATVSLDEVDMYEQSLRSAKADSKIKTKEEISKLLEKFRDKKIVFTNGCFDILHVGHVKYLEIAKSFGDMLIVGLNSDDSVKRLKGESRPINPSEDRAYVLSALESVSFVVEFEEDTPYELISIVQPDVLVKGGDYEGKVVVGSDIAKEVRLVDFVDGKSTTNIIKKAQL